MSMAAEDRDTNNSIFQLKYSLFLFLLFIYIFILNYYLNPEAVLRFISSKADFLTVPGR